MRVPLIFDCQDPVASRNFKAIADAFANEQRMRDIVREQTGYLFNNNPIKGLYSERSVSADNATLASSAVSAGYATSAASATYATSAVSASYVQFPKINKAVFTLSATQSTIIAVNNLIRFNTSLFADTSSSISLSALTSGAISITINSAAKTWTRSTGSFLVDGFTVGMILSSSGFSNSGNNGNFTITAVTATIITCSAATGLVNETSATGVAASAGVYNISLAQGYRYNLECLLGSINFSGATGFLRCRWYNLTDQTSLGTSMVATTVTNASNRMYTQPALAIIDCTSGAKKFQLRITVATALTSIDGGSETDSTSYSNYCVITNLG